MIAPVSRSTFTAAPIDTGLAPERERDRAHAYVAIDSAFLSDMNPAV